MTEGVRVMRAGDLAEGDVRAFELDGAWVAVARSGGEVFAFSDECTHAECPLSKGLVLDGQIECECHGAMFDLRTGAVTKPPAVRPIPVYPVAVQDGDVVVTVPR